MFESRQPTRKNHFGGAMDQNTEAVLITLIVFAFIGFIGWLMTK